LRPTIPGKGSTNSLTAVGSSVGAAVGSSVGAAVGDCGQQSHGGQRQATNNLIVANAYRGRGASGARRGLGRRARGGQLAVTNKNIGSTSGSPIVQT
jgi:hypothetical protein